MARQIITKENILEFLDAGCNELRLQPNDIVTDVATEFAQQNGIRIIRQTRPSAESAAPGPETPAVSAKDAKQIRQAVIGALGSEPENLDQIIAKVLRS